MGKVSSGKIKNLNYVALGCLVVVVLAGCNNGGGSSKKNTNTDPDPGNPAPTTGFSINVDGGTTDLGTGGSGGGGFVNIMKQGGSGPVEILNTGTVDASFAISSYTADLGSVPLIIDSDTTLLVDPASPPAMGTAYTYSSNSASIYISDGDAMFINDPVATGLRIEPGVTFILPSAGQGIILPLGITVRFSHDVHNAGSIKSIDNQTIEIVLHANNYYGEVGSSIDLHSSSEGVDSSYIHLTLFSHFINQGEINGSGFSSINAAGTNAGEFRIFVAKNIENTGEIFANGGNSGQGQGGNAGKVTLQSETGSVFNSGSIIAMGGNGCPAGQGGSVSLIASAYASISLETGFGEIRNSGDMNVSGGTAMDSAGQLVSNIGGGGGGIEFLVAGGDLRNNASLTANGGNTEETAASEAWGGFPGNISFRAYHGLDLGANNELPAGDVLITGNLSATGGNALNSSIGDATGGGAVSVHLDLTGEQLPFDYRPTSSASLNQRVALLGYASISANASDGKLARSGGQVFIDNYSPLWDNSAMMWVDGGGGAIVNEANISARGGNLTAEFIDPVGTGVETSGNGGSISFRADIDTALINPDGEQIINRGNIDLSGGDILISTTKEAYAGWGGVLEHMGSDSIIFAGSMIANGGSGGLGGGQGGEVYFMSYAGWVDVQGTFMMDGGSASDYGANGGLFQIEAMNSPGEPLIVDVNFSANGGNATMFAGGGGGFILQDDEKIIASGEVNAVGGNADIGVTDSVGGPGGNVFFGAPIVDSSNMTVNDSGGMGQIPGTP